MINPIYLDHQSTTPLDPRVLAEMMPYLEDKYGNPHSSHAYGWEASKAVESAKADVANLLGANPGEIIFTSGATEANNLALQGAARARGSRGGHIITTTIEHKCIFETAGWLSTQGLDVDFVPVDQNARVNPADVLDAVREDTFLVSVMMANNEVGTIQPISEIGRICAEHGIAFHTDASQAVGKLQIDVTEMNIDMLSLSAHKFYGPKGIGALYRSKQSPCALEPLLIGGGQQDGFRAGTVPTFLCVGVGTAARIAKLEMEQNRLQTLKIESHFLKRLQDGLNGVSINGDAANRIPGHLNITFPKLDADEILNRLSGKVCFSTGSACSTGFIEKSHVLIAMGYSENKIDRSCRFGISHMNTIQQVEDAAQFVIDIYQNVELHD